MNHQYEIDMLKKQNSSTSDGIAEKENLLKKYQDEAKLSLENQKIKYEKIISELKEQLVELEKNVKLNEEKLILKHKDELDRLKIGYEKDITEYFKLNYLFIINQLYLG